MEGGEDKDGGKEAFQPQRIKAHHKDKLSNYPEKICKETLPAFIEIV